MESPFDLKDYESPHDSLPSILWRVTHAKSQGLPNPRTGGLKARNLAVINDEASLKREAANHFKWSSRDPSCFLSVFTDEQHAGNWARKLNSDDVCITRIITAMLPPEVHVFDATSLSGRLGINHPHSEHELIFLHQIPWQSLGQTRQLRLRTDIKKETFAFVEIHLLQGLNDNFATFISHMDDTIATLPSRGDGITASLRVETLASSRNVLGMGYRDAMRLMVLEMFHKLNKTSNSGHSSNWDKDHSFEKLCWLFMKELRERNKIYVGFEEDPKPETSTPLTPPRKMSATEIRMERAELRKKRETQKTALGSQDVAAAKSLADQPESEAVVEGGADFAAVASMFSTEHLVLNISRLTVVDN